MQKLYYSISEVSKMVDEEQHILRYWEKEFSQLKPRKNRGGNRIYSEKDVQLIKIIKNLLRSEKLTLKNAKNELKELLENSSQEELFSGYSKKMIIKEKSKKAIKENNSSIVSTFKVSIEEAKELYDLLFELKSILKKNG